jgi:hypothetical protein
MAKLSAYPSLGYFPQNTAFTLNVSLTQIENLVGVLNSNGETFDYIQYHLISDGVKETQFFFTQPDQN